MLLLVIIFNLLYFYSGEVFIGIQFCWDGADMFNFSGKTIWPLSVSVLNLPKDLRDKMNIGLHVVAMCSGNLTLCITHAYLMLYSCISHVILMQISCNTHASLM